MEENQKKTVKEATDLELATELNQCYQNVMALQSKIIAINEELSKRKK